MPEENKMRGDPKEPADRMTRPLAVTGITPSFESDVLTPVIAPFVRTTLVTMTFVSSVKLGLAFAVLIEAVSTRAVERWKSLSPEIRSHWSGALAALELRGFCQPKVYLYAFIAHVESGVTVRMVLVVRVVVDGNLRVPLILEECSANGERLCQVAFPVWRWNIGTGQPYLHLVKVGLEIRPCAGPAVCGGKIGAGGIPALMVRRASSLT